MATFEDAPDDRLTGREITAIRAKVFQGNRVPRKNSRFLWRVITDHIWANDTQTWISIQTMADEMGVSRKTVEREMPHLLATGLLARLSRRGSTSIYWVPRSVLELVGRPTADEGTCDTTDDVGGCGNSDEEVAQGDTSGALTQGGASDHAAHDTHAMKQTRSSQDAAAGGCSLDCCLEPGNNVEVCSGSPSVLDNPTPGSSAASSASSSHAPAHEAACGALLNLGLGPEDLGQFLALGSPEVILAWIGEIERRGTIRNPVGFLRRMLEKGARPPSPKPTAKEATDPSSERKSGTIKGGSPQNVACNALLRWVEKGLARSWAAEYDPITVLAWCYYVRWQKEGGTPLDNPGGFLRVMLRDHKSPPDEEVEEAREAIKILSALLVEGKVTRIFELYLEPFTRWSDFWRYHHPDRDPPTRDFPMGQPISRVDDRGEKETASERSWKHPKMPGTVTLIEGGRRPIQRRKLPPSSRKGPAGGGESETGDGLGPQTSEDEETTPSTDPSAGHEDARPSLAMSSFAFPVERLRKEFRLTLDTSDDEERSTDAEEPEGRPGMTDEEHEAWQDAQAESFLDDDVEYQAPGGPEGGEAGVGDAGAETAAVSETAVQDGEADDVSAVQESA